MKLTLIDDWKKAWKFASIQWGTLGVFLMATADFAQQTMTNLPPAIQDKIPNSSTIALILFLLGIVGRLFKLAEKPDGA